MKLLPLVLLLGTVLPAVAEPIWVPVDVDREHEAEATHTLEASGLEVISWSNAVVEVSDFEPLALRPVANLGLTEDDPRWDPWLRGLEKAFRPDRSTSLVWVRAESEAQARSLVGGGGHETSDHEIGPRLVTGWTLVLLGLLYGMLRLISTLLSVPGDARWTWALGVFAVLALGTILIATGGRTHTERPLLTGWLQHRWFQEAWPYGARWEDWKPGQPWVYASVERQGTRLVPVQVELTTPDEAWAEAAWESLDAHHAARLFGPENP